MINPYYHEIVACSNCGDEYERRHMEPMNTGRRTQYLCPACYRKATMDIYASRTEKIQRMQKLKRNK